MMVLATSYPAWFFVFVWLVVLVPVYPGLFVLVVAAFTRGRRTRFNYLIFGTALTVVGVLLAIPIWRRLTG